MTRQISRIDPPELRVNQAFAQGVIVPAGSTLYVGGQNGVDSDGRLADGPEAQTALALRNLLTVLTTAGTGPEHVAKLTIYLIAGVNPQDAFAASAAVWGQHRTAITVLVVAGLAVPGALVEVDAVAMLP